MACVGKTLKASEREKEISHYIEVYMEIRILFDEGKKGRLRLDAMSRVVRRVPSVLLVFSRSRQARAVRALLLVSIAEIVGPAAEMG